MGVGFGYPFVQLLFGIRVYSYTHYPIVSEDMIKTVASKEVQFNNNKSISESPLKMAVKQHYYRMLIQFYKVCGMFADEVAANSSWTRAHMDSLWNKGEKIKTIYPPCDTSEFIKNISLTKPRENMMISFAQFRPEKDHMLQLEIWKQVLSNAHCPEDAHFTLIGTCRGEDDRKIVESLKERADELGIRDRISFELNVSRDELFAIFQRAKVAIHTMKSEHFGISVVELMSSGCITIAHNSAGPKMDIIGASPKAVGYLGDTAESYAFFVLSGLMKYNSQFHADLKNDAREWVKI